MGLYGNQSLFKESLVPSKNSIVTSGLIAHWTYDESSGTLVNDLVNFNNGTMVNTTDDIRIAGKVGSHSIDLDGVSENMTYLNSVINREVGSISHWIWPNASKRAFMIYESDGTSGDHDGEGNTGADILEIHTALTVTNGCRFVYQSGDGSAGARFSNSGPVVDVGAWTHFVSTWDVNGNNLLYLNGALVATKDMSTFTFSAKTTTVRNIGKVGNGEVNRWFDGRLDDIRVYDRIIDLAEVIELNALGV